MNFVFVFMFDLFIVFCEAILPRFGKKKKKSRTLACATLWPKMCPENTFLSITQPVTVLTLDIRQH